MKSKKLRFMNVKEDEILTREEMKHIIAGSSSSSCITNNTQGQTCQCSVTQCYGSNPYWTETQTCNGGCAQTTQGTGNFYNENPYWHCP